MKYKPSTHPTGVFGHGLAGILVAALIGTAAAQSPSGGEDPGESVPGIEQTLEQYVVVAHRWGEPLERLSPSVSVISAEQLGDRQIESVAEALAGQPGVAMSKTGQTGSLTTLFTRGTNSNHTAILLDGRRLNPGFSGFYNLTNLTTDNLASIEYLRGASSTLYGTEGIGGVVDLRSRSALGDEGAAASVSQEYGSFDSWRTAVTASAAEGDWAASLGGSYQETANREVNSRFHEWYALPRIDWRATPHLSVDVIGLYINSRVGNPGDNRSFGYPDLAGFTAVESWMVSPRLRFENDAGWSGQLYYTHSDERVLALNISPFFTGDTDSSTVADQVDLQINYEPTNDWLFTVGTGFNTYSFDQTDRTTGLTNYDQGWNDVYVWFQANWKPTEAISLWAGARYANYSAFDDPITYNLQGSYAFAETGTTLFAKLATAYSAPNPNQIRFAPPGNPSVESERSTSWEVGVRQTLNDYRATASVLFFQNKIHNLIDNTGAPSFFVINVAEAKTQGIEAQIEWQPHADVDIYANYTYLDAISESNQAFGPQNGERLFRRPRNTATVGTTLRPATGVIVGGSVTMVSDRTDFGGVTLGGFVTARAYASYQIRPYARIFARVENLFDQKYELAGGYPALPISGYGGIQLEF